MDSRTALLWLTHVWSPEIQEEFEKFQSLQSLHSLDVWLMMDSSTPAALSIADRYPHHCVFKERDLFELPYPTLPGRKLIDHAHFAVLYFFLSHRDYDAYWVVEYDVRYSGEWRDFLMYFQNLDHDFMTSHIRRFHQEPHWHWWGLLQHPTKRIVREKYLRSFNVIYRISNGALSFLHQAQKEGWRGFAETLFPTLLFHGGFDLLDFGGNGEFATSHSRNTFYTSRGSRRGSLSPFGTMRYRPSRAKPGMRKNKLYHPVKPSTMIEPRGQRLRARTQWGLDRSRDAVWRCARPFLPSGRRHNSTHGSAVED